MRPFSFFFLMLILVLASEIGPKVGEARTCGTASHAFKGACFSNRNCANVCKTEGFPEGDCKGFRRRCFCTRPC
ncbi:defensin-like protein [Amaranthus tricolor]|uniref:defensin-like protein n=1 Tax=Amaranthus tricolor TaxID=29722 RepID=UPI00258A93AD|nr:defensin-like protein [Amaranthus tricolor]